MICDPWTIVVVPFPFTDGPGVRKRPALVASPRDFNRKSGHTLLIVITSAEHSRWPGDVALDLPELHKPCVIRMKFFTLDNRLIHKRIAKLPAQHRSHVRQFIECLLRD